MNISKYEQRVLHVLAQGGEIQFHRDGSRIVEIFCYSLQGYLLEGVNLSFFKRLKRCGFIRSLKSQPYRITELGRRLVRSQFDNR